MAMSSQDWFHYEDAPPGDFAVLGDPISHSWSPRIHAAALQKLGLEKTYRAICVPSGDLAMALDCLESLGYVGLNLTVPLKEEFAWLKLDFEGDPVNCLRKLPDLHAESWESANFDTHGLKMMLSELAGAAGNALILGAGGSAWAAVKGCQEAGWTPAVWNRNLERGAKLSAKTGAQVQETLNGIGIKYDVILNATSASLAGEVPPIDWASLNPGTVCIDLMYSESPTPFMQAAFEHGFPAHDGRLMLVHQAAASLEWWTGEKVDPAWMLEVLP